MNKYAIASVVLFSIFIIWYRGHTEYQDGYAAGQSEKYQEMLKSQQSKTVDLYASNSYLSAQIDGMQNMLNDRNESIKKLNDEHQIIDKKLSEAIRSNEKWACSSVPSGIANGLRTNSDSREASPIDRACTGPQ